MKARVHDVIKTLTDVQSDFAERVIPRGTVGTIVECYCEPEGYAVDLAIPDDRLVGGATYVNVVIGPAQFEVLEAARQRRRQQRQHSRAAAQPPSGGETVAARP